MVPDVLHLHIPAQLIESPCNDGTIPLQVPPMEEFSGDALPVLNGGDWHELLHQGVPYGPGDLTSHSCHGAHSSTIAGSYV